MKVIEYFTPLCGSISSVEMYVSAKNGVSSLIQFCNDKKTVAV